MKSPIQPLATILLLLLSAGAGLQINAATFGEDVAFLTKHVKTVVLTDSPGKMRIAVIPSMQGRVMTSASGGDRGMSYGWINRELIASGRILPHMNAFGGEDRFWMGPEGGQYSIFFAKGNAFDLEHWFTPPALDNEPFDVTQQNAASVTLSRHLQLTNYTGTRYSVKVDRTVELLPPSKAWNELGIPEAKNVGLVAFESVNRITNSGKAPWRKESGLLSIWILGMFNPSPGTTIVVPIKSGSDAELGPRVNADYFGRVPADRLVVRDNVLFFRGDGQYRSKIGINPRRALPVLGSYDAANRVLTVVQFSIPAGATDYVNSMWEIQKEPYAGDAANSYNDGPATPGAKPMGPFYELESSSPAIALAPGGSFTHTHRTMHLQGDESVLDPIARRMFGVALSEIAGALK
jgi:hypothetical protein